MVVLDVAVDTFWEHGYEGTAVQELCAAMGINPASLYGAFGDKHQLFMTVLDRYVETVSKEVIGRIGGAASGLSGIAAYFECLIDSIFGGKRKWGCLITNSAAELALHDPEVAQKIQIHLTRIETAFGAALARAQTEGELAEGVGPEAASYLVCLAQGLNVLAKTKPTRGRLNVIVETALRVLRRPGFAR